MIANDNAGERCLFVGFECFLPRLSQIWVAADAAWICVFENRDRRLGEFRDQSRCGADIENVVKGKLFAMKLLEMLIEIAVERRGLVRVFAVAQSCHERER